MICINKNLVDMNLKYSNIFLTNDDKTSKTDFDYTNTVSTTNNTSSIITSGKCKFHIKVRYEIYPIYYKIFGLNKKTNIWEEVLNCKIQNTMEGNSHDNYVYVTLYIKGELKVNFKTRHYYSPYYWNGDYLTDYSSGNSFFTVLIDDSGKLYTGDECTYGGWDVSDYSQFKCNITGNDSTRRYINFYNYTTYPNYTFTVKDFVVSDNIASLTTTDLSSSVKNVRFMTDEAYNILKKMNISFYDGTYTNTLYTVDQIVNMFLSNNENIFNRALDYLEYKGIITTEEKIGADIFYTDYFNYTQSISGGIMKLYNNSPIKFSKHYLNDVHKSLNMVIVGRNPHNDSFIEKFLNPETGLIVNQIKFLKFKLGLPTDETADIKIDYINRIDMIDALNINIKVSNIIN